MNVDQGFVASCLPSESSCKLPDFVDLKSISSDVSGSALTDFSEVCADDSSSESDVDSVPVALQRTTKADKKPKAYRTRIN